MSDPTILEEALENWTWSPSQVRYFRVQILEVTQAELAQWLGCTLNTVSNWERGFSVPTGVLRENLNHLKSLWSKGRIDGGQYVS